jgi:hypothetical protein
MGEQKVYYQSMKKLFFIVQIIVGTVFVWSVALAAEDASSTISLGVFSKCFEHGVPCGWEKFKEIKGISIQRDTTGFYVNMTSIADVEGIGKRIKFKSDVFQWVRWRWRVRVLPLGAREDVKKKNDSAAGFYIAFKGFYPFNHVLKYAWSASLPVGTITKSPHHGGTMVIIVRSGPDSIGEWMSERRNILDDYKTAFGSEPPVVEGIAIQSDSDNTGTSASADFADIIISRDE